MPRNKEIGAILTSGQELEPELADALEDVAKGMSLDGAARKHQITKERLKRAKKVPQGSQLMRRIKREMRLPDKMGKEELLHKIKLWIEKEEVKEEAKLSELVGAAMNYARLAGYLEAPKLQVQNNMLNIGGKVSFASLLQRVEEHGKKAISCESATKDVVDV